MSLLTSKNILALGIIAFLVMSFWTLYSMPTDDMGRMVNCPFMNNVPGFCQMSLSEHISLWQQTFTATQARELLVPLLALLVLVASFFSVAVEKVYDTLKYQSLYYYFYERRPEIMVFNHLRLAFSDGLIHPKIYA